MSLDSIDRGLARLGGCESGAPLLTTSHDAGVCARPTDESAEGNGLTEELRRFHLHTVCACGTDRISPMWLPALDRHRTSDGLRK